MNFGEGLGREGGGNIGSAACITNPTLYHRYISLNVICKVLNCYNVRIRNFDKCKPSGGLVIL